MKKSIRQRKIRTIIVMMAILISALSFLPITQAEDWGNNIIGIYPVNSQVTVGEKFYVPINITVVWYIDTVAILNLSFLPVGRTNFSNSTQGDLWGSPTQYYHPQDGNGWSAVYNATGNCTQFTMAHSVAVNDTNKSLTTVCFDAKDVGLLYINASQAETLRFGLNNGTDIENATVEIHPNYPSSFSVSSGISWDNLTWTRGTGEDNAVIRYSTSSYPTTVSEGTLLYNGSLEYYNFSKDIEQNYYYSVWGWNETEGWYSLSYGTNTSTALGELPSGFTATTDNRTQISLNWTTDYTSTLTLRPNDNGSASDWDSTDTYNWQAVDEESADDGSTRNRVDTNGARDSYNITDHTSETAEISNVTVYSCLMDDGSGMTCRIAIYDYTQGSYKNNTAFSPSDGTYTTYSHTWLQNPWTSSAWTWDDIDRLEIGVEYVSNEDDRIYITQTYAEVTYANSPTNVVERNTVSSWERGSGTEIYNGTNVSYTDTGLYPGTLYYYQLWTYDGDTNFSSTNISTSNTTSSNQLITLAGETPSDDSGNVDKDYATVNVTINDPEGDLFNWTIEGLYVTNTGANDVSNGSKSANLITSLPYSTDIIWYVNTTDGYNWTNATYNFTSRDEYSPSNPSGFTATAYNRTQIDLSWTLTDDKSYLEWNTTSDWPIHSGTTLDNGSNESFSHTGLTEGTTYYYQIWSYNTTDNVFSSTNASDSDTTDANQGPTQHGETPTDDSGQQELELASVNVTLYDPEGDTMSWWIETSTGDSDNGAGATNGTSVSCSLTNPHDYEEEVVWFVNVTDGTDWTNETYNFTARSQYSPTVPTGFIATTYNRTRIDLEWTNADDKTYIERNTIASWEIFSGSEVCNSSGTTQQDTGLDDGVHYYYQAWSYNTTDNVYSSSNSSADNTTTANQVLVQTGETPTDDTGNIDKTQSTVNVTLSDVEGDTMSWNIDVSTGDTDSGSSGNGSISCSLSTPLTYDANIIWYVNVSDGYNWTNGTYNFTVRSEYVPSIPTGFTATNISSTQINLAWTNNPGNVTYIEYNTTSDWPIFSGTFIDNSSSNTTYQHSGLTKDTMYYYQAWSYNTTDNVYSSTNATTNNRTQSNTAPSQISANDVYPANATEWIEPGEFRANVTDIDGDAMDVSFYWQNGTLIGTDNGVPNGSTANFTIPFLLENYTWYYWYVNVTDGEDLYNSQIFTFRQEAYDWDIDRDSKCYPSDLSLLAGNYMTGDGTPWWIRADISRDGYVNPTDLSLLVGHYMEEY